MIKGNLVHLRPFEKKDAEIIASKINHFETLNAIGRPFPISLFEEEDFVTMAMQQYKSRKGYFFVIEENIENNIVGSTSLSPVDFRNRSAVFGITIFEPKNFEKGYGTEATTLITGFAFNILNLNRVELNVFEFNERAMHVYEKVGYKKTGTRRQFYYINGKYHDAYMMDILAEEFFDLYGRGTIPKH